MQTKQKRCESDGLYVDCLASKKGIKGFLCKNCNQYWFKNEKPPICKMVNQIKKEAMLEEAIASAELAKPSCDETHYTCKEMLEKLGGKAPCCGCSKHECATSSEGGWEAQFDDAVFLRETRGNIDYISQNQQKNIKSFISTLLVSKQEEIVKNIAELWPRYEPEGDPKYEELLSEIINQIMK